MSFLVEIMYKFNKIKSYLTNIILRVKNIISENIKLPVTRSAFKLNSSSASMLMTLV